MASVSKLVLLLLCTYHTLVAHAAGDDLRSYKVLPVGSPKSAAVNCTAPRVAPSSGGVTVPLHHRHGPCSPLPSTKAPTWEEMLQRDQLRAAYVGRKFSAVKGSAGDVEQLDATKLPTTPDTSSVEYVITVGIGSPAVTQTMTIDTGSDVSWVQCKPCSQCRSQANPLFDPSSSSTYSAFSCSSAACTQLGQDGQASRCSGSQCQYNVTYGDLSSTTGTYSSDTLALDAKNAVKNFQFGCSQSNSGLLLRQQTAGLMGLGGGAESLVSQTAGTFGKAFSYCLPTRSTAGSSGFLTLGAATSGFAMTPMFKKNGVPTFYFVRLEAIRVGGKQLNIPASVFSTGSVMDSGTSITQLPPAAYSALSSAFKAGMKQYRPAPSGTGTCFDFSGQSTIRIPTVALVFSGGVVLDLPAEAIIQGNCLAFTAWRNDMPISIIGNVQQQTFEVLYDVGGGAFGFKAGAC